jgi:hypothetical protein
MWSSSSSKQVLFLFENPTASRKNAFFVGELGLCILTVGEKTVNLPSYPSTPNNARPYIIQPNQIKRSQLREVYF